MGNPGKLGCWRCLMGTHAKRDSGWNGSVIRRSLLDETSRHRNAIRGTMDFVNALFPEKTAPANIERVMKSLFAAQSLNWSLACAAY
jgi:hypothetical protein